jgi:pimeloyl-ACP methyl ester carboxylesterase
MNKHMKGICLLLVLALTGLRSDWFLSGISAGSLILTGESDHPVVHALAGIINAGIRKSIREVIPGSGHLVPIEQPVLFNEAVGRLPGELVFGS